MGTPPPELSGFGYPPAGDPSSIQPVTNDDIFSPLLEVGDRWPIVVQAPRQERRIKYALLLLATFATTTVAGAMHYAGFRVDFGGQVAPVTGWPLYVHGLWYSLSILAILGSHEMGHYLACRYYGVDASLPYFLPAPVLTGTLGAFIRIRQPIPSKRQLFDIGIAGPIAGFVVAVPLLIIGLGMSNVVRVPPDFQGMELGEPLLFRAISWCWWGSPPDGYSLNLHPMAFAAWFGLLATALNLFPIGQLDGGHISYAVFGRRSTVVTFVMVACLVGLTFVSSSWVVWTVLTIAMLLVFGPRHPRTYDEDVPLDRPRAWLALGALAMFAVCFTPAPIEPLDLVRPTAPAHHERQALHPPAAAPRL